MNKLYVFLICFLFFDLFLDQDLSVLCYIKPLAASQDPPAAPFAPLTARGEASAGPHAVGQPLSVGACLHGDESGGRRGSGCLMHFSSGSYFYFILNLYLYSLWDLFQLDV